MFQGDLHESLRLLPSYSHSSGAQDFISPHCHVVDNPCHFLQEPPWSPSFLSKFLGVHKEDGGGEGQGLLRGKKDKGQGGEEKGSCGGCWCVRLPDPDTTGCSRDIWLLEKCIEYCPTSSVGHTINACPAQHVLFPMFAP